MAIAVCIIGLVNGVVYPIQAQVPSPTPVMVQLSSPTPLPILGSNATPTHTPTATETPIGPVQLGVAEGLDRINVRREADPNSEILGVIAPGERYPVTGRYYRWIQFRFPNSPNGLGYVYDELVQLFGDTSLIPDLTVVSLDLSSASESVPSGIATVQDLQSTIMPTSEGRVLTAPVGVDPNAPLSEVNLNPQGGMRLPTYTPAPNIGEILSALNSAPTETPVPDVLSLTDAASSLPPITPIALLAGLGLMGLMLSALRRG